MEQTVQISYLPKSKLQIYVGYWVFTGLIYCIFITLVREALSDSMYLTFNKSVNLSVSTF